MRTSSIAVELQKVRADPDYLPPICLSCGQELGKPIIIGVLMGIPIEGKCIGVDHEDDALLRLHGCRDDRRVRQTGLGSNEREDAGIGPERDSGLKVCTTPPTGTYIAS